MKIGITGSLASGKTTVCKLLSNNRYPLFSADKTVKHLYQNRKFKKKISKKFRIKNDNRLKNYLKKLIFKNKTILNKLEKIIHPLVRKEMRKFTSKHKNKKILFYEIPLLIESKLMKFFDIIIFVKCSKLIRMKRFLSKQKSKKLFRLLDNKQLNETQKSKFCDYVVVNEKNLNSLKKNLSSIMNEYE